MSRKNHRNKWPWIGAVVFFVLAGLSVLAPGQERGQLADPRDSLHVPILTFGPQEPAELEGLPDDWSHHHLVFSDPGTEEDAIQKGTYDDWLRIVNDPRYIMQQLKVRSPAQGPAAEYVARMNEMARAEEAAASEELAAPQSTGPIGPVLVNPGRMVRAKVRRDWSMDLGSGGMVGAGQFPAKYAFSASSASCSDYVLYPTGLAGSSSQATVVAYNNIYATTCTGTVPSIYWAYNTGGTATLSPTISLNGSQIAYIQVSGTTASLVLLTMASSGGTVGTPVSPASVANSSYYSCTAPCYTTITLNGSPNDTNSSPFYDYTHDIMYVGDNSGKLHKFTPVFNGTPAEVTTSGWPITVSSNKLTSPVYDVGTSNYVFVADSGGYLYSYAASSATHEMTSSKLTYASGTVGIVDAPLLDSNTEMVYVFAGEDANTSTTIGCDNATGCSGVFQFAAGNTTTATAGTACAATSVTGWPTGANCGKESLFGVGTTATPTIYDGSFDQIYYSGTGTTGNLWSCSANLDSEPRLSYVPMSAFVPTGRVLGISDTAIAALASATATCSPLTEIYGSAGSTDDYIFLSVTANGSQAACTGACLYNFVVSINGTSISVPTAAAAGLTVAGGSSGISIDNISTAGGASQIYFSSLSNEACAGNGTTGSGTGGCAVQASQTTP
jgi:hypothetical protein